MPTGTRELLPAMLFGVLGTIATIGQMTLLSAVVSRVFIGHERIENITAPVFLLLCVVVLRAMLVWLAEVSARQAVVQLLSDVREWLFSHLFQLGPAFVRNERSGELTTTAMEGVDQLAVYYSQYLPLRTLSVVTPVLIVSFILTVDPPAAILLLCTAPLIPLLMVLIGRSAQIHAERHWIILSRLGAQFLDTLQGLPTLLLFGCGAAVGEKVRAASETFQERTMRVLRVAFLSGMVLDIMTGMAIGLVAVVVAIQLLTGALSFQSAFLVLLLAPECYRPLRELGAQRHAAMEGTVAAQRIVEIMQTPIAPHAARNDAAPPRGTLALTVSNVSFTYPTSDRPALTDVCLTLPAGTRTALVGRSGAGKSTLVSLLLRFLEPDTGTIIVNGIPLAMIPPDVWRTSVALVSQQPHLFVGTIRENLRLARPDASRADVMWAVEQAGATNFIAALPEGYDTPVGEQGARLSAGQVQRIAIARAFLKDAPLLVLDEPTSALDPESEARIRRSLERLMMNRTTLVVAHRLNTVLSAEQIAVLTDGRLTETGSHHQLLQRSEEYAHLMGMSASDVHRCL